MGRVLTCKKNCNTIDLRRAQVNKEADLLATYWCVYCMTGPLALGSCPTKYIYLRHFMPFWPMAVCRHESNHDDRRSNNFISLLYYCSQNHSTWKQYYCSQNHSTWKQWQNQGSNSNTVVNPCGAEVILGNKQTFAFSTISHHWDGAGSWNTSLWKIRTHFIQHNQYHGYWCPGDARSQGISSHGIDLIYPAWSISWLLMSWRHEEPGHQQPWY